MGKGIEEKAEEIVIPIPKLKVIDGGRNGEGNWLNDLELGTVFAAAQPSEPFLVGVFCLEHRYNQTSKLCVRTGEGREERIFVDTLKFSKAHLLKDILIDPTQVLVPENQ